MPAQGEVEAGGMVEIILLQPHQQQELPEQTGEVVVVVAGSLL
jgi:hypothetical protein